MMNTLGIASYCFLIGAIGQWAFYFRLFPRLPQWLVMGAPFIAWLTIFTISFCNRPPFGPRLFRRCLLFAMCWYAVMTLAAEVLYWIVAPAPRGYVSLVVARLLMYCFGVAGFLVFVRASNVLRSYEIKSDGEA
jgi:hypothetical protein